jgi:hypothetical protein
VNATPNNCGLGWENSKEVGSGDSSGNRNIVHGDLVDTSLDK